MGWKRNEDTVEIEGRIEHTTEKAVLIDTPSSLTPVWIPKRQIMSQTQVGVNLWVFEITEWIAGKNNLA